MLRRNTDGTAKGRALVFARRIFHHRDTADEAAGPDLSADRSQTRTRSLFAIASIGVNRPTAASRRDAAHYGGPADIPAGVVWSDGRYSSGAVLLKSGKAFWSGRYERAFTLSAPAERRSAGA